MVTNIEGYIELLIINIIDVNANSIYIIFR